MNWWTRLLQRRVLVVGDSDDYNCSHVGSFGRVHRDFEIERINDGGVRLMDWAVDKELYLIKLRLC